MEFAGLQYLLQFCNTKKMKPEEKTCYSSNYIKLTEMQQYATKCASSATLGGLVPLMSLRNPLLAIFKTHQLRWWYS